MDNTSQSPVTGVTSGSEGPVKRGRPTARGPKGRFLPRSDTQERRRLSAELKARGASWSAVAAEHWGGDRGLAIRETNKWYAENPTEDVETTRRIIVDTIENLESVVRQVMSREHYVTSQRGLVTDAEGNPLIDDKPIYEGVDRILKMKETLLKLIPGLAAPKVTAEISEEALDAQIAAGREALEREMAALSEEDDGVLYVEDEG